MNITNERGGGRTVLFLMLHLSKHCMGRYRTKPGTSRQSWKVNVSEVRSMKAVVTLDF